MITLSPFSVSHFLYHYLIWYFITQYLGLILHDTLICMFFIVIYIQPYTSPSSIQCDTGVCYCLCYKELSFNEWIWHHVRTLFKLFFSLICMILTISEFFRKGLVCIWFAYSEYDSWLHLHCRCTIFDGRCGFFFML